ncbi:MAG TPA: carboxypeptidase regulatory-like domain-containing protein [Gemmatimonadaceae bacterium]|nr:carboxypeptidase regulatory-like domain-containing protein [Gemmatimonadaceae bacterium]
MRRIHTRPFGAGARGPASLFAAIVALVGALTCSVHAGAQQADVIRGRITSSTSGAALDGATVTATTLSGGVTRPTRTDRNGRYTITFANGEGDYWISVIAVGYVPRRFELKRTADQDILVADVRMTPSSSMLDTVSTVGRRDRPPRRDTLADIGGMDRGVNTSNIVIEQLGNLALMAATTPGLLFLPGVNGDPAGFSAFGLDPSQNSTAMNGMNSGATDLPRDGEYGVGVALSPYDVSQGQFSGGRVNVRVASGTNYTRSLSSFVLNTPSLEWTDHAGRVLGQEYSNLSAGGGASGPLSLNTSFYNLSYQAGRVGNDMRTLLNTDPLGLKAAGIASDSVARLMDLLAGAHIPATVHGFPATRHSDQGTLLGAFDLASPFSASGNAFRLVVSAGWNRAEPAGALANSVPASLSDNTSWNGSLQAHHMGYFGSMLSETGLAFTRSRRYTTPFLTLPGGTVRIGSEFDDGTSSISSITFGGAQGEQSSTTNSIQLLNQLSWFSGGNHHRLKLTTDLRRDSYGAEQSNNLLGTFAFQSLDDFANARASAFSRQLTPAHANSGAVVGGIALGDSYRVTDDLQLVLGVRLDGNRFDAKPARNPDVDRVFGVRNDVVPNRLYYSPRLGFSWTFRTAQEIGAFAGAARNPDVIVRGGIGVFQGVPGAQLPLSAMATTGLPSGVQQLRCTGAAVPVPDWNAYGADRSAIPDVCADGSAGTQFSDRAPGVTLFDRNFSAPRSIRSNLQATRAVFGNRMRATIGGVYSRNQHQPGFVDLNFNPQSRFTLGDEGERPVFVDAASITPSTGVIASRGGRVSSAFSRISMLQSRLTSTARQFQFMLTPTRASTHYTWGINYTLNSTHDAVNGFSSTGASPLDMSAGRSAYDWRHQWQLSFGYNLFDIVRVQWFHSFVSGVPYTPMVVGDINGDGSPVNDRAFVFDPARTSDASLAAAMSSLLSTASSRVRDCLQRQLGRVASRSSCEAPWTSTAALRIDFNPIRVRMPQRTMISLSVSNPLAGLDLLLHGTNHTHGWGQFKAPDENLLFVRGFDPVQQHYRYEVNPRFGNTNPQNSALRSPVAVTALVRIDLGPSRERQDLTRTLDRGRTTPGDKVTAGVLRSTYSSAGILNPVAIVLRSADSLHLDGTQADSLATLNRWVLVRLDSIWTPVARELAALPDHYPKGAAYARYVKAREASVDLLIHVAPSVNHLLSGDQRRKLPALTAQFLDLRYLRALRSRTPGLSAPVFPPPAGTAGETGGRARGGGP